MPEQRGRAEADDLATRQRADILTDPAAMISADPGNEITLGSDGRLFIGEPLGDPLGEAIDRLGPIRHWPFTAPDMILDTAGDQGDFDVDFGSLVAADAGHGWPGVTPVGEGTPVPAFRMRTRSLSQQPLGPSTVLTFGWWPAWDPSDPVVGYGIPGDWFGQPLGNIVFLQQPAFSFTFNPPPDGSARSALVDGSPTQPFALAVRHDVRAVDSRTQIFLNGQPGGTSDVWTDPGGNPSWMASARQWRCFSASDIEDIPEGLAVCHLAVFDRLLSDAEIAELADVYAAGPR